MSGLVLATALCATATLAEATDSIRVDVDDGLRTTVTWCAAGKHCQVVPSASDPRPVGDSVLFGGLPWRGATRADAIVVFHLPPTVAVSTPGMPVGGATACYAVSGSARGLAGVLALGPFPQHRITVAGGVLDVAVLGELRDVDVSIQRWLEDAAQQLLGVYGVFPVPRVQVVVVPATGRGDAVPFGRVLRDGGPGVQFFVDPAATLPALLDDWTATHELSHLLLPYIRRADSWMSEGFASYYQNVLRARAGAYDARQAWQKLVEGFDRGQRQQYADTLTESIRNRGDNFLMRLYWSGAAIALLADVELRRSGSSLDAVLAGLQRCCLPSTRSFSAMAMAAQLDRLGGDGVFERLRARWTAAREFPSVGALLYDLGVRRDTAGRVRLDDAAPLAAIRRDIEGSNGEQVSTGR
jgi:hypothetical protein